MMGAFDQQVQEARAGLNRGPGLNEMVLNPNPHMGKAVLDYLVGNLTGKNTVYEEVPKEYYDTPSIFAEPRQEVLSAEIDLNGKGIWKTGKPVKFKYIHNNEKAPYMGERFGQHLEPAGKYIQKKYPSSDISKMPNMEEGEVIFKNPLVIEWGGGYGEADNWKQVLSSKYDGKTGQELSRAIKADGYDGIVTWDKKYNEPSEIVDLRKIKQPWEMTRDEYIKQAPLPQKGKLTGNENFDSMGRNISAVKLDDGTVYYDTEAKIHADMIDNLGIPPERIVDGGFIINGKYVTGGADAPRIGRQNLAKRKVRHIRAVYDAFDRGEKIPKRVLKDYPDLTRTQ